MSVDAGDFVRGAVGRGRASNAVGAHAHLRKSIYPHAVSEVLLGLAKYRVRTWDAALRDLQAVQMKELRRTIAAGTRSEFGRAHDFSGIRTHADFAARIPLADYDAYSPAFERIRKGESRVLTNARIEYIGNSAGSSNQGKPKFLPISEEQISLQRHAAADGVMRLIAARNDNSFLEGFMVGIFPPALMRKEGPVHITNNPALMMRKMPSISWPVYLPDPKTMLIENLDEKMRATAESCLDRDVRAVNGTTCWFSLFFDHAIAAAQARGRTVSTIAEIWPNLRTLVGGGVAAEPYAPVIRDRMGTSDFALLDTYNASEGGVFAATDGVGRGMLMIPDRGVFFEFVPLEELDTPNPTRLPLWEVETGKNYAIHVTTVSGLYGYRLGDIVQFSSTWPHRIEFAGRLSGCLSTTQELTTHLEVQNAMQAVSDKLGTRTVDYAVGAEYGVAGSSKARYMIFAEFEGERPDLVAVAAEFDRALCAQNRVYREHRDVDTAILAPLALALTTGASQKFMKLAGMTSVQNKFPRIVDNAKRDILLSLTEKVKTEKAKPKSKK